MFGATLKATNSSFQKGMIFCHGIYVKRVMELLAFIFEQPSYQHSVRFAFKINSLDKIVSLSYLHTCKT